MIFDDKLHEECGVFGAVVNNREASGLTYNALSALQNRAKPAAGVMATRPATQPEAAPKIVGLP